MCGSHDDGRLKREQDFYDREAASPRIKSTDVIGFMRGATSPENRFILDHLGDVRGKKILELGCGHGEASIYFAMQGADCIATDGSPAMLGFVHELAAQYGVQIETRAMDASAIDYPDNTFDIVYAANTLHHTQPELVLQEMRRVVKPGGKVCFWDPLRHNPVINVYRRIAKDVRTEDETPLHINIVDLSRRLFSAVAYDTFWIISLLIFIRFYFIDKVDPNKEPYWKKVVLEEGRLRQGYYRLERIDRWVKKLSFMKRFAWNVAVVATK